MMEITISERSRNDWTLDTNVLINANGRLAGQQRLREDRELENHHERSPQTNQQVTRALLNCISQRGHWCWSKSVAQEYQSRGAIHLRQGFPPIPVQNQTQPTWVDNWLAQFSTVVCISPKVNKLIPSEEDKLRKAQFRDVGDFPFLALSRSSTSKRLVTKEGHYNSHTIPAIKRILGVRCLDYQFALSECSQE